MQLTPSVTRLLVSDEVVVILLGFQKMQDDILSADLRPVLKELSEIDCGRFHLFLK